MCTGRRGSVPLTLTGLRRAALAGMIGLLASSVAAQTVSISAEEARAGLRQALADGRLDVAEPLAQAILRRAPQDYAAHAALSQIALQRGDVVLADRATRQAVAHARSPRDRFEAALLRARVTEQADGPLAGVAAMYWTRRAAELAPHPAYRSAAVGELQRIRGEARLQLNLGVSVAPSSNVNNGSRETYIELPGWGGLAWLLSPQSRALSGWVAEATVSGRYRLAESAVSARYVRFAAQQRKVRLSGASRRLLDDWRAWQVAAGNAPPPDPDYDFAAVEAGVQQIMVLGKGQAAFGATLGHNWFGGRDLSDYLRLDAQLEQAVAPGVMLFGSAQAERQWRKGAAEPVVDTLTLQAGAVRHLESGARLRLSLGARHTEAASLDTRHKALMGRIGWEPATPMAGVRIETSLGIEGRRYDPSMLAPQGRRDLRLDAGVSVTFQKLDYMGFAPMVDLRASRNASNVKLYDGRDLGIAFGIRSVF